MPDRDFTDAQVKHLTELANNHGDLVAMLKNYRNATLLGRLFWKLIIGVGVAVGAVATFGEQMKQLISLLGSRG